MQISSNAESSGCIVNDEVSETGLFELERTHDRVKVPKDAKTHIHENHEKSPNRGTFVTVKIIEITPITLIAKEKFTNKKEFLT